ncbi:hypothetical protein IQ252_01810 [Tychonema sp. LEGE 07203]|nr:hypothetical protein [Tychonema sp. LEGE 07203]
MIKIFFQHSSLCALCVLCGSKLFSSLTCGTIYSNSQQSTANSQQSTVNNQQLTVNK